MKKYKVISVSCFIMGGIGVVFSIINYILNKNAFSLITNTGEAEVSFIAIKTGTNMWLYVVTAFLLAIGIISYGLYKKRLRAKS